MENIIELQNVSKKFSSETALKNISLKIERGEMVAITGESGCGKTTLLNILGLIMKPTSGNYNMAGVRIDNINSKKAMLLRRNKIGYLFQNYGLVEDETVDWNLRLAYTYKKINKAGRNKQIIKMLKEFNLSDVRKKKIYELSGGQQQRIALIRLLIKDSDIILADEPTGSLDPANRDMVMDYLKEFNENGKTVVVVTHDPAVAGMCQREIKLSRC